MEENRENHCPKPWIQNHESKIMGLDLILEPTYKFSFK